MANLKFVCNKGSTVSFLPSLGHSQLSPVRRRWRLRVRPHLHPPPVDRGRRHLPGQHLPGERQPLPPPLLSLLVLLPAVGQPQVTEIQDVVATGSPDWGGKERFKLVQKKMS